jgi:hypothetical protein
MAEPFRFLDLPKELRLMVYDFLPIRTTHHQVELELDQEFDRYMNSWLDSFSNDHDPLVRFMHQSINVAILRTCRTIASEASAILLPKLIAMRNAPTRILVTPHQLHCLYYIIHRLTNPSYAADDAVTLLRQPRNGQDLWADHGTSPEPEYQPGRQIQVTVCEPFADPKEADVRAYETRIWKLRLFLFAHLRRKWEMPYYDELYADHQHVGHASINFRVALLWGPEAVDFDTLRAIFSTADWNWNDPQQIPRPSMTGGPVIEAAEWERDWAERERYLTFE